MKKAFLLGGLLLAAISSGVLLTNLQEKHQRDYIPLKTQDFAQAVLDGRAELYKELLSSSVTGEIEAQDRIDSWNALQRMSFPKSLSLTFGELGPDNIGGRTRAIGIDRSDDDVMYAGSVGGGLFKSTDHGSNWARVNAWDVVVGLNGSISISSIETTSDGTLYVAMGGNQFEIGGSPTTGASGPQSGANGVWYSTDNGDTFTQLPGTSGSVTGIWRDPSHTNRIYIAGTTCLVSENHGTATAIPGITGVGYDVKASGDGSVVFFITRSGSPFKYYVSTNSGASFTEITGSLPSAIGRAESTVTDVKNGQGFHNIYVSACTGGGSLHSVYISEDNGSTWTNIGPGGSTLFTPFSNGLTTQGVYDQVISYIPNRPDECVLGGINQYHWAKSPGSSPAWGGWTQISMGGGVVPGSPTYIHSDQHEMKWNSAGEYFYGSDGGVGSSFGGVPNGIFYPMNRGLNVTQFYSIAFNRNGHVMGGTQDNGTLFNDYSLTSAQQFRSVLGGDGFDCEFSHYNPEIMFGTIYNALISRSEDVGNNWQDISPPCASTQPVCGIFRTPLRLFEDPDDIDSRDFIEYIPDSTVPAGTTINYNSLSYDPSVPENLLSYTTSTTLYYTDSLSAAGNVAGDYFALHPGTADTIWMGIDSLLLDYAYDTLYLQDPVQSLMATYGGNPGSNNVFVTRDALRFGMTPEWWDIGTGTGFGGAVRSLEFSLDGNILYVGTANNGLWRFKGLDSVYDVADVGLLQVDRIYNTARPVNGIAIDKNNADRLVIAVAQTGGNGVVNLTNVQSGATANDTDIQGNIPSTMAILDVMVDYHNPDKLAVGTDFGVWASSDGGLSWTWCGNETGPVPVFAIRQQQREWNECTNSGEIYIGTHGRGIWSSQTILSTPEHDSFGDNIPELEVSVYPNPARDYTSVSFHLATRTDVEVQVLDINGKMIRNMKKVNLVEGDHQFTLDVINFASGTYLVRLETGYDVETIKFVKE